MDGGVGGDPQYDVFADEFLSTAPTTTALRAWRCSATWPAGGSSTRRAAPAYMPPN